MKSGSRIARRAALERRFTDRIRGFAEEPLTAHDDGSYRAGRVEEVEMNALRTVTVVVALGTLGMAARSPEAARRSMAGIVARIQKADYEGDRKALVRLAAELAPYTMNGPLASRARYWRGFALWRRALNAFNEKNADPKEIERDLLGAVGEFTEAAAKDSLIAADANSAAAACSWSLAYLNRDDAELRKQYILQGVRLKDEAVKAAPENPRVLWVVGGGEWYVPPERGGGQAKAIATYERGLELARKQKGSVTDPLEPTWGEPELHMNLAWSHLGRATLDLDAAESNARAALAIVPNWHYVRDILLPQILEAKTKKAGPLASASDFDFLEGKWEIVYNNTQPGIPPNIPGSWVATKQTDGRVLYDEFRLLGPQKETVFLCATFRVFDHVRQKWDMRYVGLTIPGPGEGERQVANWAELTAWREGSTIRVDQKGGESWLRITYSDIAKDHFRWKADVSNDGGKTWKADQIRIEAKRAP
jgi:tetratricopeptide (TPR) repeat protein